MIAPEKVANALHALNAVLVTARLMAYEREDHDKIANVLDVAEYLPMLMLEAADRTAEFRGQLEGLTAEDARFGFALERFDGAPRISR